MASDPATGRSMDTGGSLVDPLELPLPYNAPDPVDTDPLIEVLSVTLQPYEEYRSYQIYGQIYVYDKIEGRNELYNRRWDNPETITSSGNSLSLTGPVSGVISMVGAPRIFLQLKVQPKKRLKKGRAVWFANGDVVLDTTTQLCYEETKCLTFKGSLGVVRVDYIVMPCACIADVEITSGEESVEYDISDIDRIGSSPDAYVSGSIIACYGKTNRHFGDDSAHVKQDPSFKFFNKSEDECGPVVYGVPIKLDRSFVCMPAYSSIILTFNLTFKDSGDSEKAVVNESIEFKTIHSSYQLQKFSVGKFSVEVLLNFFTSDHPWFLEKVLRSPKPSSYRIGSNVPEKLRLWGRDRIEVLSVFVGDERKETNDLYGIIVVKFLQNTCYIFRRDENNPDKLCRRGKSLSLEGLTTEHSDWFLVGLRLKDMSGLVDIHNHLHIFNYHYDIQRQWFNRPLCSLIFGNHGYAVVHYIIFRDAAKATVKISVVAKKGSHDLLPPVVYGGLVAQYSNYDYSTSFQRNYWRSVLFEEKDARRLSADGELPLCKNVLSVPMGVALVIDVDLHASVPRSAGAPSHGLDVCNADHFKGNVEIKIADNRCKKLQGEYYDVLFSAEWTNGI